MSPREVKDGASVQAWVDARRASGQVSRLNPAVDQVSGVDHWQHGRYGSSPVDE